MWASHIDDIKFSKGADYSFAVEAATMTVIVLVNKGEEIRRYSTRDYLKIVLTGYSLVVDEHMEEKDEDGIWSRITAAANAKVSLLRHISGIQHYEKEHKIPEENRSDFSDILEHAEAIIERIKLDMDFLKYRVEIKKYNLELKKLDKETRPYREWMLIGTFILALLSALLGLSNFHNQNYNLSKHPATNNPRSPIKSNSDNGVQPTAIGR